MGLDKEIGFQQGLLVGDRLGFLLRDVLVVYGCARFQMKIERESQNKKVLREDKVFF
jgi:hypothetical protein